MVRAISKEQVDRLRMRKVVCQNFKTSPTSCSLSLSLFVCLCLCLCLSVCRCLSVSVSVSVCLSVSPSLSFIFLLSLKITHQNAYNGHRIGYRELEGQTKPDQ